LLRVLDDAVLMTDFPVAAPEAAAARLYVYEQHWHSSSKARWCTHHSGELAVLTHAAMLEL
jgi:hypothetical protein